MNGCLEIILIHLHRGRLCMVVRLQKIDFHIVLYNDLFDYFRLSVYKRAYVVLEIVSFYEELLVRHSLQHFSGTEEPQELGRFNCDHYRFIGNLAASLINSETLGWDTASMVVQLQKIDFRSFVY